MKAFHIRNQQLFVKILPPKSLLQDRDGKQFSEPGKTKKK